ncbi:MAG: AAA family ATPase [Nitrospinae bacterium]|nr:AAA family ATPase [Nitrospinota bacterium]
MYCSFFGLQEKPFSVTPDPRFLFRSKSHQEALGHLLYGIEERKGFIEITGEVGTGKTILCRALLEQLGQHVRTALILNSFLSEIELLRSINEDFGISAAGTTKKELIDELNQFLIRGFSEGQNAVLIIDESQNLAPPVLEQIRMLSNLETDRGKLLQIILVGQPELRSHLERPDLRQLNQRIAVRYHIRPLDRRGTEDYIHHRLLVAGSHGGILFSKGGLYRLYRECGGIPRKINLLCDRALLTAYVLGTNVIDGRIIRQAGAELEGGQIESGHSAGTRVHRRWWLIGEGMAVGLVLMLGGAAWFAYLRPRDLEVPVVAPAMPSLVVAKSSEAVQLDAGTPANGTRQVETPSLPAADEALPPVKPQKTEPPPAELAREEVKVADGDVRLRPLLWEYSRALRQGGGSGKPTLAGMASTFGLEVLPIWTDLSKLKQFRVACVVETFSSDLPTLTFLIPRASSPDDVELTDALGNTRRFTNTEFTRVWLGRAYLFHRSGTELKSIFARGKRGTAVETLQQQLGDMGYLTMAPSGVYDGGTVDAVRRFQRDYHLQVDGSVGPSTKIMLYYVSGQTLSETVN